MNSKSSTKMLALKLGREYQ